MQRNVSRQRVSILALLVLIWGCGGGGSGTDLGSRAAAPNLAGATAPSTHYVELSFDGAPDDTATRTDRYSIVSPEGAALAVRASQRTDDGITLTTDAQEAVAYQLTMRAVSGSPTTTVAFPGSTGLEPGLLTAIALSNTEVLLTFSEPMQKATTECTTIDTCRRYYRIVARGSEQPSEDVGDVDVLKAVLSTDGKLVTLTTSAQVDIEYEIKVANVRSQKDRLIDPNFSASFFFGVDPNDATQPQVVAAQATNTTTILITFSEPMDDASADPIHYSVCGALRCATDGGACQDDDDCTSMPPCQSGQPCDGACAQVAPCVTVGSAELSAFKTQVTLTTLPLIADVPYTVQVTGVGDRAGNPIDPANASADFTFDGNPGSSDGTRPRVVGGASTGNTSVVVAFSKPMADNALNPASYVIVQVNINPEVGFLTVLSDPAPQFTGPDRQAVILNTLSQSELTYEVTVVNVTDLAGNPLAPPELLVDPSKARFPGTPPTCGPKFCNNGSAGVGGSGGCITDDDCDDDAPCDPLEADCEGACEDPCELADTDGDGLTDNLEQRGWVVTVALANGDVQQTEVTSSPFVADSDNDGFTDQEEWTLALNPRLADTDGDTIPDYDEYNVWYTEPTVQDSDEDGITDGLETGFFKTNPLIDDTDGDGFDDARELFDLNRDPRISDLPRPRISIGDVALRLDTHFTFTDTEGTSRTDEETVETSLSKSTNTSFSRSDSNTSQHVIENTTKVGISTGTDALVFGSFDVSVENELKFGFTDTEETTVTRESSEEATEAFNQSLSTSETVDETREVTREVAGASMQVPVTVANASDIPFTVTNLEVTALLQNPVDRTSFLPIATLVPESALDTGTIPAITTGPFQPERGPFVFTSREVFPTLIEDLLRNPRGLIFQVANFDVTDEFGRNLAFISQEVNDRTAGVVIDYGNRTEHFRVSTNSTFDDLGRSNGITLGFALQDILRREKNGEPDAIVVGPDGCGVTVATGDDVQVVEPACPPVAQKGDVVTAGANGTIDSIPRGDDKIVGNKIVDGGDGCAHSSAFGDDVQKAGVCDGLSKNPGAACDGDAACQGGQFVVTHPNGACVLVGQVRVCVGQSNHPLAVCSSDAECQGQFVVTDPYGSCLGSCAGGGADGEIVSAGPNGVVDSTPDGDDLYATISGYETEISGRCDAASTTPRQTCGANSDCGQGLCQEIEILKRVGSVVTDMGARRFWTALSTAAIDPATNFDDIPLHAGDTISLAYVQDGDRDGVIDRQEFMYGSSDEKTNSDDCPAGASCAPGTFDALSDFEEVILGWDVSVAGRPTHHVFSDPSRPDSDGDRLTDSDEMAAGTDPRKRDTDEDGISDFEELSGYAVLDKNRQAVLGVVAPYSQMDGTMNIAVVIDGGDQRVDTTAASTDQQVAQKDSRVPAFAVIILPGDDGTLNTTTLGGDDRRFTVPGLPLAITHAGFFATDPLNADTDGDTLSDGVERILGAAPNDPTDANEYRDDDRDGLTNAEETSGWTTTSAGGPGLQDYKVSVKEWGVGVNNCGTGSQDAKFDYFFEFLDLRRSPSGWHDVTLERGDDGTVFPDPPFTIGLNETVPIRRIVQTCTAGNVCTPKECTSNPSICGPDETCTDFGDGRGICTGALEATTSYRLFDGAACMSDGQCLKEWSGFTCDLATKKCVHPDPILGFPVGRQLFLYAEFEETSNPTLSNHGHICQNLFNVQPGVDIPLTINPGIFGGPCEPDATGAPTEALSGGCYDDDQVIVRVDVIRPTVDVDSDPFEPDTDFDGLPDLLERLIGSDPRSRDGDGDGLLDFDEFDPASRLSISRTAFIDFQDACFAADRCGFSSDGSELHGTNVASPDSDSDGRTDSEEVFDEWAVIVVGKAPYRVKSSPKDADADDDGLGDSAEFAARTDPEKADTDGDGALDGTDPNPTQVGATVKVRLLDYNVGADDCDQGDNQSFGDYAWTIVANVVHADGMKDELFRDATGCVPDGSGSFCSLFGGISPVGDVFGSVWGFTNKEKEIKLSGGDSVELRIDIEERRSDNGNPLNLESDSVTPRWQATKIIEFGSLKTGTVVVDAANNGAITGAGAPTCMLDDKVTWSISAR